MSKNNWFTWVQVSCMQCGKLADIDKIHEDYIKYICKNCGETFAIINTVKYPHGV